VVIGAPGAVLADTPGSEEAVGIGRILCHVQNCATWRAAAHLVCREVWSAFACRAVPRRTFMHQPDPQDDAADDGALFSRLSRGGDTARLRFRLDSGDRSASQLYLRLTGELDVDTAAGLRETLATLTSRSTAGRLVLDLSGITFCDTASLYTLRGVREALPLAGVEVLLVEPSTVVRVAAERAGLCGLLSPRDEQ
jgi:anti-anti-sigma factor